MNIKLTLRERETTRLALAFRYKLVTAAQKATAKALVETMTLDATEALLEAANGLVPRSNAVAEVWDASPPIMGAYRDSLFILGGEVSKVRKKEIERGIDTSSSDERLNEIRILLRSLGDQRDLFVPSADDDDDKDDDDDDDQLGNE